jgi:hypothetical protein
MCALCVGYSPITQMQRQPQPDRRRVGLGVQQAFRYLCDHRRIFIYDTGEMTLQFLMVLRNNDPVWVDLRMMILHGFRQPHWNLNMDLVIRWVRAERPRTFLEWADEQDFILDARDHFVQISRFRQPHRTLYVDLVIRWVRAGRPRTFLRWADEQGFILDAQDRFVQR